MSQSRVGPAAGLAAEPVAAAVVTVVFAPACHYCDDAQTALGATYPLAVERVDIRSERGQTLIREHRPPMSPLVLLDEEFFSFGRLPRRKRVKALDRRVAEVGARP